MQRYLIIIPAYNEAESIGNVLRDIKKHIPNIDILVIDDGSTDSTSQIAKNSGAMVVNMPFNIGYGGAVQTGFRFAVKNGYDFVITMDADTQHDPSYIKNLMDTIDKEKADVVIGSRFLGEGNYTMEFIRKIGVRIFSAIAMFYTGARFTDPTSGFQILNRKAFNYLSERDNYPLDYPDVNIIIALHKMKFKVIETPVRMRQKKCGKSMHNGLKPVIYVVRMFLAILIVLLRKEK